MGNDLERMWKAAAYFKIRFGDYLEELNKAEKYLGGYSCLGGNSNLAPFEYR
jgi:hypothetical protein